MTGGTAGAGAASGGTRFWVDAWDPGYAAAVEGEFGSGGGAGGGPAQESTATVDPDVELPAAAWRPLAGPPDLRPPDTVLMLDGVRRIDARIWTGEPGGESHPGLAVSFAAGVVRCDLRHGAATLLPPRVERRLFTASPTATGLGSGQIRYDVHRVEPGETAALVQAVQGPMTELEVRLAGEARNGGAERGGAGDGDTPDDRSDLLVVDGSLLPGRQHLPRTIGYIKTQQRQYLPPELTAVVTALPPGWRSPVFRLGTSWDRYTWYLRLPGASGAPWSGMVRAECAADLRITTAVALADQSVMTLPRFAATAYKDPRAPQNLVPIAGLERRLRSRLGDAAILHRALVRAAAAASTTAGAGMADNPSGSG